MSKSFYFAGRRITPYGDFAQIRSRDDLIAYLDSLVPNIARDTELEVSNPTEVVRNIARYLRDLDGVFKVFDEPTPDEPSWALIAMVITSALYYE